MKAPPSTSSADLRRLLGFITLFVALAAAIFLAGIARVAQSPAAGASGGLERIAPGALGVIRFELAQIGSGRIAVDPALARRALGGLPFASDPFTALAADGLSRNPKGTTGREAALLAEALRRDPRSRTARILLLRQLAASGDLEGAFSQLAAFGRLNPGLVETIMEAITSRITTPRQVDEALAAIDQHEALYRPFVKRMSTKAKPAEVVLRLAERLPAHVMTDPDTRGYVVEQLVKSGQYAVARNIWQRANPSGASGLVHSPDFSDSAASPPFNWKLAVDSTGAAERNRGGGLNIAYYDRNPGPLAEQLLTLGAGLYRLRAEFEVLGGTADNVQLVLACIGSEKPIAAIPFTAGKTGINRRAMDIAIPALGCPGQTLSISGVASEERGETQLLVRRIDLTAKGGSQ